MSDTELFELTWYLRDYLFRNHNQEGTEIVADNIPVKMKSLYLRYRNSNIEHLTELAKLVTEKLQETSVLIPFDGSKLKMNAMLDRWQCSNCKYISYLTNLEEMKCFRCGSKEIKEFMRRRA